MVHRFQPIVPGLITAVLLLLRLVVVVEKRRLHADHPLVDGCE